MGLSPTRLGGIVAVTAVLALGACGDGEDRPGQVTSESGTGTGSASASGTGSASASGTGEHASGSASGTGHGAGGGADFTEADADTVARVSMKDYAFSMPATVKGPKVFFQVVNEGPGEHEFMVEDADGKELAEIEAFAKSDETKTLALELEPGSYKAVCLVEEGQKTHRELGMETSFTVE